MIKRSLLIVVLCVGACVAESFLVKEKPRRRTRQQLKQEIIQRMGSLIEQSSVSLEKEAQIQQKLCKELRTALEGKSSVLNRASIKDLHQRIADLQHEQQRRIQQQATQERFLAALN